MWEGKRIVIGITGGIAAYKISFLIRMLKSKGAEVKCVLTPASSDFISPLTVATLSQNPAYLTFWNKDNGEWTNHVDLGAWGDVMLIAPLTANSLAKLSNGFCDNLLTATYLSAKCPVFVAPAMDLDMYAHPTTSQNLDQLRKQGVNIIPAETGFLASGLTGQGRMAEPETIMDTLTEHFTISQSMSNQKVLITAGPTYESIDPVRFIGNHSTGKMGFALAENCLKRGAEVVLVTGPTQCKLSHSRLTRIDVQSANEMYTAVHEHFSGCNGGIFSAAVSDYRPNQIAEQKIKKSQDKMVVEMVKNPDILKSIGAVKKQNQWLVGFALETNDALKYGAEKLKKKNLDLIVVNTLQDKGAGFGFDTNKITLLDFNNKTTKFELTTKKEAAKNILDYLLTIKK
ncbi:bifunctional phosphopantothenoylcysteine decarboxylase/phosphopantothenate--cysteine ligase CoaBC [Brumimicrobium salinarum]|uniref:Coenzyme A biosynthesis bifunctional protein CoaBC n=1 Tax=Brumimicrobium salinarum TaxID=2058658 RepID=A0A2I0R4Q7_9FLAO|nr:bifunctional phosphopantothenoylcysteine decarboxylase/phosphopantothenate--cysteine ligase CoaBC [Brumimicrobium salinarum]PKR81563.1 bifunctional phosphopantothenoylcysteine decarboxylase/phosphopantothenate--cysteine ligase CoaBC [Brumimicrobium salinarum]